MAGIYSTPIKDLKVCDIIVRGTVEFLVIAINRETKTITGRGLDGVILALEYVSEESEVKVKKWPFKVLNSNYKGNERNS